VHIYLNLLFLASADSLDRAGCHHEEPDVITMTSVNVIARTFVYAMSLSHQEIRKSVAIKHGVKDTVSGAERLVLGEALGQVRS
jgi:hypothetical protein